MQTTSASDVGSNAIRMAAGQVNSTQGRVDVIENIHIPVRLGQDVTLKDHDEYCKDLGRKDQLIASQLCALLRLTDAIEVSHTTRIHNVKMTEDKRCWHLQMNGKGNLLLEK